MIPHPLTLLVCWLIGAGLSPGLGYVVGFIGELCVDAQRYGVLSPRAFAAVFAALGWFSSLAGLPLTRSLVLDQLRRLKRTSELRGRYAQYELLSVQFALAP